MDNIVENDTFHTQLLGIVLPSEYILRYPAAGYVTTQPLGRELPNSWVERCPANGVQTNEFRVFF